MAVVCYSCALRAFYIKMQKPGGRLQTILFFIAQAQNAFIITLKKHDRQILFSVLIAGTNYQRSLVYFDFRYSVWRFRVWN